jgi:signal transduction histidine kinase
VQQTRNSLCRNALRRRAGLAAEARIRHIQPSSAVPPRFDPAMHNPRIEANIPHLRLEYRLPLLVSIVLTTLLGAGTWLAYREVAASSHAAAMDRMGAVATQLTETARTGADARTQLMRRVASDPAVQQLARGERDATDPAVSAALQPLRIGSEDGFTAAVLSASGASARVRVGSAYPELDPPPAALLRGGVEGNPLLSPYITHGDATYYWMAVPLGHGAAGGHLAQLRRLGGNPRSMEGLVGEGADIFLVNGLTGEWAPAGGGRPLPAPVVLGEQGDEPLSYMREGEARVAIARAIPNADWHVVIDRPLREVIAPARSFVMRATAMSMLLVLSGLLVVGLITRRLLRPIGELGAAARDIALGNYDRRVEVRREDEIGQLANAFNSMAAEVDRTVAAARHSQSVALEASHAKSAFLATMSHEVRTPINAIMGYVELLDIQLSGNLNNDQRQFLERIRESSRHLTALVEDVLDLAKGEAGELRVAPREILADAAVRAALNVVVPQAKLRGIELTSECTPIAFVGDPQRVRQILVNLLSNAVKFTDSGGRVSLRCYLQPGEAEDGSSDVCCFEVTDTGCGIPAEQQAAVFEPFVQIDSSYTRTKGGAGLGLAISLRLARLMHGDIDLRSELGQGSTFTLRLPVPANAAVAAGQ